MNLVSFQQQLLDNTENVGPSSSYEQQTRNLVPCPSFQAAMTNSCTIHHLPHTTTSPRQKQHRVTAIVPLLPLARSNCFVPAQAISSSSRSSAAVLLPFSTEQRGSLPPHSNDAPNQRQPLSPLCSSPSPHGSNRNPPSTFFPADRLNPATPSCSPLAPSQRAAAATYFNKQQPSSPFPSHAPQQQPPLLLFLSFVQQQFTQPSHTPVSLLFPQHSNADPPAATSSLLPH